MQQKVTEEGKKEQDTFMGYCQTSGGDLAQSINDATERTELLTMAGAISEKAMEAVLDTMSEFSSVAGGEGDPDVCGKDASTALSTDEKFRLESEQGCETRALQSARTASQKMARPELDLLALALSGKAAGFEEVLALIDEMMSNPKQEQEDDDTKKEYFTVSLCILDCIDCCRFDCILDCIDCCPKRNRKVILSDWFAKLL